MHQEYEEENTRDDEIDMSISMNECTLDRVYKNSLPPQAQWKNGTTLIIGDSMIGGIDERRLRNTKVRPKPGATIEV